MVHIRFREHGLTLEEKRIKRNAAAKRRRDAARTAAGKVRRGTGATCQWGARKANGKCPRWSLKANGTQVEKQMALDTLRMRKEYRARARAAAGPRVSTRTCKYGARNANGKCPRWTLKRNGTQQEKQMALDSARFKRQIKKRGPTRAPR